MSKAWSGGSTRGYRAVREQVLIRDGHRCRMGDPTHLIGRGQARSAGCTGGTRTDPDTGRPLIHVHHTAGRGITGDDPAFMVTSCQSCNLAAGDPVQDDPAPRPLTDWGCTPGD